MSAKSPVAGWNGGRYWNTMGYCRMGVVGVVLWATLGLYASVEAYGDEGEPDMGASVHAIPLMPSTTTTAPTAMLPLPLEEGFAPALHVAPSGEGPRPVMIFLHGIRANVEEQCGWWRPLGDSYGWLLCLRGDREPNTTVRQDLWTYRRRGRVHREIEVALAALEARYPGRVSRQGTVLAGYSRGAIMAPKLVLMAPPGRFPYLFLAEGGQDAIDRIRPGALRRHGVQGVGLAMGTVMRRRRAERQTIPALQRAGLQAVYVDMPGAGHRIGPSFPIDAPPALRRMLPNSP
ncbi:MAG: hypothetical protein AAFS10_19495 [Myxococcota bacterium]